MRSVDAAPAIGSTTSFESPSGNGSLRVLVLCDFLEEQWPSMDLVGDMLCRHLVEECGDAVRCMRLRPPLRRRFTRLPLFPRLAWNADRLMNRFVDYPFCLRIRRADYDVFHLVDHSYA